MFPAPHEMLAIALQEAETGSREGGVPVGAALFGADGRLLGRGRNRRVQDDDPSVHGETDAFRRAGRQRSYRGTTMATTLAPCWYCSGVVDLDDDRCVDLMSAFIARRPDLWFEDIGGDEPAD
jgi:cytosine/creatinine deaminase